MYQLFIQDEAIIELQDAFNWYEFKRKGLGLDFVSEVETGLQKITNSLFNYSYTGNSTVYRKLKIKRFPYILIYEIEGNNIFIIHVRNTWMKPLF